ncbi:MAG: polysaccharide deacetylase family protein [Candidatus Omnitrophica bacterium]|nr:polysaccharide deacetylase family protein [Candidatus Omnitrophota bacterium]
MRIVALTFHDIVADDRPPTASEAFYRLTAEEFERLLTQLRKLGYQAVSSRTFRAWQGGQTALPERSVVLTFDDGYASHFEVVVPLLLRYRLTGTFFVPVARIGQPGYMTWDQLRRLVFLGMEIGSHGVTHRPLTQLSRAELAEELGESKRRLEEELGIPVRALAAPGGCWNRRMAGAVHAAGYEAAWVSTIGTNGAETQPLALRRVVARQPFSAQRLVAMVEGWQPAFWWAANQQLLIRLLKRLLGVYGYEQLKRRLVPTA